MNSDFLRKTGVPGANNVVPQLHAGFVMLENLFLCLYFIIVIVKRCKDQISTRLYRENTRVCCFKSNLEVYLIQSYGSRKSICLTYENDFKTFRRCITTSLVK